MIRSFVNFLLLMFNQSAIIRKNNNDCFYFFLFFRTLFLVNRHVYFLYTKVEFLSNPFRLLINKSAEW